MADIFDLYGIPGTDMDTAAQLLPGVLGLPLEPHESSYWGDYYLARSENRKEKFTLKENYNLMEEDWNRSDFKQYPLLLEVSISSNTMKRAKELENRLKQTMQEKIVLLEREEFSD